MLSTYSVLSCPPCVGDVASRWCRALGDGRDTILRISVVLSNAVKVNRRSIGGETICDMHFDSVAPICSDHWAGNTAIDSKSSSGVAVRRDCSFNKLKPVLANYPGIGNSVIVVG